MENILKKYYILSLVTVIAVAIIFSFFITSCDYKTVSEVKKEDIQEALAAIEGCDLPNAVALVEPNNMIVDIDKNGSENVKLNGKQSIGENITTYIWSENETILGDGNNLSYDFSLGTHLVTLTVINKCGLDKNFLYINVVPPYCLAPTAKAGSNRTIIDNDGDGFEAVSLDASGSTGEIETYEWYEDCNNTTKLLGTEPQLPLSLPIGTHLITLRIEDICEKTDKDAIYVNVTSSGPICPPPTANAGLNRTIRDSDGDGFEAVSLNALDLTEDIETCEWFEDCNDSIEMLGTSPHLDTSLTVGSHIITLRVTNKCNEQDKDAVLVNILPYKCKSPVAKANSNHSIIDSDGDGFEAVSLNALDLTEDIETCEWFEDCNDSIEMLGTSPHLDTFLAVGSHIITLRVTNKCNEQDKDAVLVNIHSPIKPSNPPIANAGSDKTLLINETSSVCLDGSDSYDPDGYNLNYTWYSIPENIKFKPDNHAVSPVVSLPTTPMNYYFILQVNDGVNYSEIALVKISVTQPNAWVGSSFPDYVPVDSQFKTIQGAIDAISDGTNKVIAITYGQYEEKVSVSPYIYLFGLKSTNGNMPLISSNLNEGYSIITLDDYATIDNLRIMCKGGTGMATKRSAISVIGKSVNIKKCQITYSESDGLNLESNSSTDISNSLLIHITGEGIVAGTDSEVNIKDCIIFGTNGSAIWGRMPKSFKIYNSFIYGTGWHGIHIDGDCNNCEIEHCSLVDFGRYENPQKDPRSGIWIASQEGVFTIKSNLILIENKETLSGIHIHSELSNLTYLFNYIYSKQQNEVYYEGAITINNVDNRNYPNTKKENTEDPKLFNPDFGDFSLDANSPALNLGENATNPGADNFIINLRPAAPFLSEPIPDKPFNNSDDIIFQWKPSISPYHTDLIEYCITINEDLPEENIDDPFYKGCDEHYFLKETSFSSKEHNLNFKPGKDYWWAVWAIWARHEDSYGFNGFWSAPSEWRKFSISAD